MSKRLKNENNQRWVKSNEQKHGFWLDMRSQPSNAYLLLMVFYDIFTCSVNCLCFTLIFAHVCTLHTVITKLVWIAIHTEVSAVQLYSKFRTRVKWKVFSARLNQINEKLGMWWSNCVVLSGLTVLRALGDFQCDFICCGNHIRIQSILYDRDLRKAHLRRSTDRVLGVGNFLFKINRFLFEGNRAFNWNFVI